MKAKRPAILGLALILVGVGLTAAGIWMLANYRAEQHRESRIQERRVLEEQFLQLEQKVKAVQEKIERLERKNPPQPILESDVYRRTQNLLVAAEMLHTNQARLLNRLRALPKEQLPEELISAIPNDPLLIELWGQLKSAQQKFTTLTNNLPFDDPEVNRIRTQCDIIGEKLYMRADAAMKDLESRFADSKAQLDSLKAATEEARRDEEAWLLLGEARQELKETVQMRDAIKMKMASEDFDRRAADHPSLTVVDMAGPAAAPVSRNHAFGAGLLLLGVITILLGLRGITRT